MKIYVKIVVMILLFVSMVSSLQLSIAVATFVASGIVSGLVFGVMPGGDNRYLCKFIVLCAAVMAYWGMIVTLVILASLYLNK